MHKITKIRDSARGNLGLLFQIQYPLIGNEIVPTHRFMSAFEQKIESPDSAYQYLIVAADPYESVGFKIQSQDIEMDKLLSFWDSDVKQYTVQFTYRINQ